MIGAEIMQENLLEQILYKPTVSGECKKTIEEYAKGTFAFFTPKMPEPPKLSVPTISPIGNVGSPSCVQYKPDYLSGGTERFRKPEYDNIHGLHTNYEITIPGIKKSLTNIHIKLGLDDEDGSYY